MKATTSSPITATIMNITWKEFTNWRSQNIPGKQLVFSDSFAYYHQKAIEVPFLVEFESIWYLN